MSLHSHAVRSRMFRVSATVAVLALTVAGCSRTGSDGSSGPAGGGELTIVQSADIALTGWFSQTQPNLAVQRLIFNSLIEQDVETLEPKPSLAESWEQSGDGATITFELRDDVKFHDGTALTADDVIASIDALNREEIPSQLKSVASLVTDVEPVGDQGVQITLDHAVSNLFDLFEMMPIIDDATVEDLFTGDGFNGTGPFAVDAYTPGQGLEMSRYDDYWGGPAKLDAVNMKVVRDSQSMLTALRSGDADVAVDLAPLDAVAIKDNPDFTIYTAPAMDAGYFLASNVNDPVLADKEVRKAIATGIDRDRILEQVLGGNGRTTSLPWSPNSPANDEALTDTYEYDSAAAAQRLEELGAAGKKVKVYYDANNGITTGIAQVVIFNLKEMGLDPATSPLQSAEFLARLRAGELDGLFINVHGFGQMAPATLLSGAFPFNAAGNASQFVDETYQQLAEDLVTSTDDAAAEESIAAVNEFLLDQQFVSDLVATGHTYTYTSSLKDMTTTLLDYPILDKAYLDD